MSAANAKEADDVSELLGGYVAAALYSKLWQLREAGLNHLQAYLSGLVSTMMDNALDSDYGRHRPGIYNTLYTVRFQKLATALIAQLVERIFSKDKVHGSTPC